MKLTDSVTLLLYLEHVSGYCVMEYITIGGINKLLIWLWLPADPGCGKSVLTSYLVGHLRNKENSLQVPEIVCCFFFKEDNSEQNNAIPALQALLQQLYKAQPWLLEHAAKRYLAEGARKTLGQFGSLRRILEASWRIQDPGTPLLSSMAWTNVNQQRAVSFCKV